jgi:hypothetical protein
MVRLAICLTVAAVLAGAGLAFAEAEPPGSEGADALIIQAKDHAELSEKFCAANPNIEHIVVLPASLFVDPPFYARGNRLGCDGKAGRSMQTVAVNCRPLSASGSN